MRTTTFVITLVIISSALCTGQKLKNSAAYFTTPGKVGILVTTKIESPKHSSGGVGGALGGAIGGAIEAAINASANKNKTMDKFDTVLYKFDDQLNPMEEVKTVFEQIYTKKGKSIMQLNGLVALSSLPQFQTPTPKKYSVIDVRSLKALYQVDEVLVVFVEYGVRASYKYGVEISRMGRCEISTELVSTSDNSVVIRETSLAYDHIKGVWDLPPDYLKLRGSIQAAIREVMATEKKKYDKVGL